MESLLCHARKHAEPVSLWQEESNRFVIGSISKLSDYLLFYPSLEKGIIESSWGRMCRSPCAIIRWLRGT